MGRLIFRWSLRLVRLALDRVCVSSRGALRLLKQTSSNFTYLKQLCRCALGPTDVTMRLRTELSLASVISYTPFNILIERAGPFRSHLQAVHCMVVSLVARLRTDTHDRSVFGKIFTVQEYRDVQVCTTSTVVTALHIKDFTSRARGGCAAAGARARQDFGQMGGRV